MPVPLLIGLLVLVIVVAAAAGVWRARGQRPATVQSSLLLLVLAVTAAVLTYLLLQGRV